MEDETSAYTAWQACGGRASVTQAGGLLSLACSRPSLTKRELIAPVVRSWVASYEVGRRRIPVSMLQALALALSVDIDGLLGDAAKGRAKRGPAPVLARHMERISALPKTQQKFVIQVLESVLAQATAR